MKWEDLSPEARLYIKLQPHVFAKTTIASLIALMDKSVSFQEKANYIDRAADILKLCAVSIKSHPEFEIVIDNTHSTQYYIK